MCVKILAVLAAAMFGFNSATYAASETTIMTFSGIVTDSDYDEEEFLNQLISFEIRYPTASLNGGIIIWSRQIGEWEVEQPVVDVSFNVAGQTYQFNDGQLEYSSEHNDSGEYAVNDLVKNVWEFEAYGSAFELSLALEEVRPQLEGPGWTLGADVPFDGSRVFEAQGRFEYYDEFGDYDIEFVINPHSFAQITAVPIPATLPLMATSILFLFRRRKNV
jgi:hypothetical protein